MLTYIISLVMLVIKYTPCCMLNLTGMCNNMWYTVPTDVFHDAVIFQIFKKGLTKMFEEMVYNQAYYLDIRAIRAKSRNHRQFAKFHLHDDLTMF